MTQQQRAIAGNSPRDLRVNATQGRIYENDPAAVARLKQHMAEEREKRQAQAQARRQISKRTAGGDDDLARKRDEILARAAQKAAGADEQAGENNVKEPKMTDDAVLAVHRRYVLENLSIADLAHNLPVAGNTLAAYFSRLDLPIRNRAGKWTARAQARCCQVHDLALADVMNNAAAAVAPAPKAPAKPEPKQEPARITRPTPPAPSANGNGAVKEAATAVAVYSQPAAPIIAPAVAAGDMGAQIAALQSLLASATAQNVEVTGTIEIQLSAKINF